jgi:DNA-binding NarL/FixJ family response regulator
MAEAVRKAASGGKYVSDWLAEKLASDLQSGSHPGGIESLSDREHQVMVMLASGKTISTIGDELSLSSSAVGTYRGRVLEKLGLQNTAELIRFAIERELV